MIISLNILQMFSMTPLSITTKSSFLAYFLLSIFTSFSLAPVLFFTSPALFPPEVFIKT